MARTTQGQYKVQAAWATGVLLDSTEGDWDCWGDCCIGKGRMRERHLTGQSRMGLVEDKDL